MAMVGVKKKRDGMHARARTSHTIKTLFIPGVRVVLSRLSLYPIGDGHSCSLSISLQAIAKTIHIFSAAQSVCVVVVAGGQICISWGGGG